MGQTSINRLAACKIPQIVMAHSWKPPHSGFKVGAMIKFLNHNKLMITLHWHHVA